MGYKATKPMRRRVKKAVQEAEEPRDERLDFWFSKIQTLKKVTQDDRAMIDILQDTAIKYMDDHGIEKYRGVGVIRGEMTTIDVEELRVQCMEQDPSGNLWRSITTRVLDNGLLEAALEQGRIPPALVQAATKTVPKKEYLGLQYLKK